MLTNAKGDRFLSHLIFGLVVKMTSNPLIAYKSNALVEASYKLTLQEQRFLLLCISRLNSGTDVASPELQKTMTIRGLKPNCTKTYAKYVFLTNGH